MKKYVWLLTDEDDVYPDVFASKKLAFKAAEKIPIDIKWEYVGNHWYRGTGKRKDCPSETIWFSIDRMPIQRKENP
jgi:glycine betaine/choline ABC-type transport system substrate-binding protein